MGLRVLQPALGHGLGAIEAAHPAHFAPGRLDRDPRLGNVQVERCDVFAATELG
jgi:hypothetical protein